jgi:CheY-like chemotaxis protein
VYVCKRSGIDLHRVREETVMNKILIVDDSSNIRLLLSRTLKAAGYTVSEATDGDEVLAAALSYERI